MVIEDHRQVCHGVIVLSDWILEITPGCVDEEIERGNREGV